MRVLIFAFILSITGSVAAQTSSWQATFEAAGRSAQAGRYAEALEKYRRVLEFRTEPGLAAKTHYNIGVCLYQLGRPEKAVAEYRRAIESSGGKYQKAFYAIGMAQAALGDKAKARAAFYEAVRLDKTDGEAWFDLGMVLLAERDEKYYDAAREAFENAAANKSVSSADALNNAGVIAALKGDLITAEKKFRSAAEAGNSVEAVNNLKICDRYRRNAGSEQVAALTFSQSGSRKQISGE